MSSHYDVAQPGDVQATGGDLRSILIVSFLQNWGFSFGSAGWGFQSWARAQARSPGTGGHFARLLVGAYLAPKWGGS